MAETEVLETISRRIPTEDLRSLEISPETKQHLKLLRWSTNLARSLREKTLKTGDLLAEYRKEAILAVTGFTLIGLAAACGGKEIKAETVGQSEQIAPTPIARQIETPLPSVTAISETQTPTPTAESTPIDKGGESTPTPTPTEKPAETSLFQEINQKINQSLGTEAEKAKARETVSQFMKAEQKISEFKNYEAQRQTQGETTLLQLIQQKFNHLGDTFPEFEIEDQVFYLKDENDLKKILNQLKEKSPDELLASISESQKQFFDEGKFAGRRRITYITPELAQSPTTEFDLSKTTSPLAPKAAEEFRAFLKEIGLEGKIRLKIILADKLSMGNAAGTFSAMERVPEIELAPPFREKDFFHELAHFLDPDRNSFLYNDLTSEEIIDAFIAIEEALNSDWGRRYPEVSKIFSEEPINAFRKRQNGQPLGPNEFAVVERLEMPAGGWLTPMKDTLRNPDQIFVDFMGIFDKQFSQDFDRKLEDTLHGIREKDWSELVLSQKTLLDELAQRSAWDRAFVELLRESATSVTYSPRYHGNVSMTHLRRILFFDAAVGGDTRVAKLLLNLEPKDRKRILDNFLGQWQGNDAGTLARSVAVTISGDFELGFELDKTLENPFRNYFYATISDLTS